MFEMASRMKFRFPFKGMISTEDLWDLSLEQLDSIFVALNEETKQRQVESLLDHVEEDTELEAKLEIVKHVFKVKKYEAAARAAAAVKAEKKQKILEVLAKKQDESLQNMSEDDLLKMLNEIG
jgi:uncharacterized Zn finger protein